MTQTELAIQFNGVYKQFQKQSILKGIDLEVRSHEYLGLVGINGAGKTSLIKCLLDFSLLDSGQIKIFANDHLQTSARDRLSFLPEKFSPPYYLTGRDFLKYMLELYEVAYDESKVKQMLNTLDLVSESLNKSVGQLSKGMAQKLGLAACLLSDRELLILDEPMSGLDPKARAYLKRYLLELKEQGKTLFFSTHLLVDVEAVCDRMAVLHDGKICFIGSPAECCAIHDTDNIEEAYLKCINAQQETVVA